MSDNYLQNNGSGLWKIRIYNPGEMIGPFNGFLHVNKEHHIIKTQNGDCIVSIPSQNVAYCINESFKAEEK